MVEVGLLNAEIAAGISQLGHTDELIICDAGFPIPLGVKTIDISITANKPMVIEMLEELLKFFSVEKISLANECKAHSPSHYDNVVKMCNCEVNLISHTDFKKNAKNVKLIIRTGDFTSWANVLLVSGSGNRWYKEV